MVSRLGDLDEIARTIIETALEGIWVADANRNTIFVNNRMAEMLGYTADEIISLPWQTFVNEESKVISDFQTDLRIHGKETRESYEISLIRKDGTVIWVIVSTSPKYESGKYAGSLSMITDVTRLKKSEIELRQSENKYKELVDNARSIILKMDTNGNIVFFNEYAKELFGFTQEEILGKPALGTIVPKVDSGGKEMYIMLDSIYKDPDKHEININENIKKNGERIWVEWHNKARFDDKGNRIGHIAVGLDITERIRAENRLLDTQKKLRLVLKQNKIGIWERDLKTNLLSLDDGMREILRTNRDSMPFEEFLNTIHEEDVSFIREKIEKNIKKLEPYEIVYRLLFPEGLRYISAKARIEFDNNVPVKVIGVASDVTELQKNVENAISDMNRELLRSNTDLQQFAYIASHDLQEPLRMVTSFTQLLQKKYKDKLDDEAQEYIRYAVDGSKRMYELINGLLAFSRVHTKADEIKEVDMNYIFDCAKTNLFNKIKETNADVKSQQLPVIKADAYQMIQILQNLIDNAIKFSEGAPAINVSCKSEKDKYVFSVKDKGVGIDQKYFDRIFKIFQRLNSSERYAGIGIGLSICKRIVERHNGDIWVESEVGKGSTFCFSIPK